MNRSGGDKMADQPVPREKLIRARNEMNLTQDEVAKLAGISRTMYTNIELGKATPSLNRAYQIAKVLKKSIEQLFFNQKVQKLNKMSA